MGKQWDGAGVWCPKWISFQGPGRNLLSGSPYLSPITGLRVFGLSPDDDTWARYIYTVKWKDLTKPMLQYLLLAQTLLEHTWLEGAA